MSVQNRLRGHDTALKGLGEGLTLLASRSDEQVIKVNQMMNGMNMYSAAMAILIEKKIITEEEVKERLIAMAEAQESKLKEMAEAAEAEAAEEEAPANEEG